MNNKGGKMVKRIIAELISSGTLKDIPEENIIKPINYLSSLQDQIGFTETLDTSVTHWSEYAISYRLKLTDSYIEPTAVAILPSGDIIIAGCPNNASSPTWVAQVKHDATIVWSKKYSGVGDVAKNIAINGTDIILVGNNLMCLDEYGNVKWAKNVAGNDVAITPTGKIYVAREYGSGEPAVIKLDSNGNFLWARYINTPDSDYARVVGVCGEDVILGVESFSLGDEWTSGGGSITCLYRFNENGNVVWGMAYAFADSWPIAIESLDSNIYVVNVVNTVKCWVMKIKDIDGGVVWSKKLTGEYDYQPKGTGVTSDGITVAGNVWNDAIVSGRWQDDGWVAYIDLDGNLKWALDWGNINYATSDTDWINDAIPIVGTGLITAVGWARSYSYSYPTALIIITKSGYNSSSYARESTIQPNDAIPEVHDITNWGYSYNSFSLSPSDISVTVNDEVVTQVDIIL